MKSVWTLKANDSGTRNFKSRFSYLEGDERGNISIESSSPRKSIIAQTIENIITGGITMNIYARSVSLLSFLIIVTVSGCQEINGNERGVEELTLSEKSVAFLITEGFHDGETMYPMAYLINHGANVTVIGIEPGTYTAYNSDLTARVERSVRDVSPADFDALVIPGGHSPGNLREHEEVISFVRDFVDAGKPTAAICHGPQVLVTAGVIADRTLTGFEAVKDEITEAGAHFEDAEVIVDGNLITSRIPDDLPAFSKEIARALRH